MSLPFAFFVDPLVLPKVLPRKGIKSEEVYANKALKICISLHLQADLQHKSFTTQVVSFNSCDLFLAVFMYMQEQQNCSHET